MQPSFDVLENVFRCVAILSWQGSLLTVLVAAGLLISGRLLPARIRYVAWGLVVVRLLLFVSIPSTYSLFGVPEMASPGNWIAADSENTGDATLKPDILQSQPDEMIPIARVEPAILDVPVEETLSPSFVPDKTSVDPIEGSIPLPGELAGIDSIDPRPSESTEPTRGQIANPLWSALCVVWALGALVVLIRMGITWCAIRKQLRQSTEAPPELNEMVAKLARESGIRRPIRVRITSNNLGPAINGLFRPVLYLPDWMLSESSPNDVRLAIRHELAHVRWGDVFVLWISAIVRVLHWFNPCVRWVLSRVSRECELACDESVLKDLPADERRRYGEVLLSVVERSARPAPSPALLGFSRSSQHLKRRIEMIGTYRQPNRWAVALAIGVICGLAVTGLTSAAIQVREAPLVNATEDTAKTASDAVSTTQEQPASGETTVNPPAEPDAIHIKGVCKTSDGKVVTGAWVRVFTSSSLADAPKMPVFITSDDTGLFDFTLSRKQLSPDGSRISATLVVSSDHHTSWSTYLDLEKPVHDLTVELQKRGESLRGRVIDERGRPRPGVWVFYYNMLHQPMPGAFSALTDGEGQFEIPDSLHPLSKENTKPDSKFGYTLYFMHPDYPISRRLFKAVDQDLLYTLEPGGVVEGTVVDEVTGKPLSDHVVSAQSIDTGYGNFYQTRTDEQGHYRLLMKSDQYNIWADETDDRIAIALDSVNAEQSRTTKVPPVKMIEGTVVTGRVLHAETKKPLQREEIKYYSIRVAHYGPAHPFSGAAVSSAEVRPDGTYRLRVAPGLNRIYLMSPDLGIRKTSQKADGDSMYVVKEGEPFNLDFFVVVKESSVTFGEAAVIAEEPAEPDRYRAKPVDEVLEVRVWSNTKTGLLLQKLDVLQKDHKSGDLEWARTMRELIKLGPNAVPELIDMLDQTPSDDRMMLRSLPFILRGIGDKRAIPVLIRTIPKCFGNDGSDMGYRCDDPELFAFMLKHDNRAGNENDNNYNYGRPVNEVFGTLEQWTDRRNGHSELAHVGGSSNTSPRQTQLRRQLFIKHAQDWEQWWATAWKDYVDDPKWSRVGLPEYKSEKPIVFELDRSKPLSRASGAGNMILAPSDDPKYPRMFYDLDTGRWGGLPARWDNLSLEQIDASLEQISMWAISEVFDLMGRQIEWEGKPTYVIAPLNLQAWELENKNVKDKATAKELIESGRPVTTWIAHLDPKTNEYDHLQTGRFFYITNENTPGVLKLGVEVKDTKILPGPSRGDDDLNPKGYREGRRFSLSFLK